MSGSAALTILLSIFGGGAAGAVVSYYLQRHGRVWCVVSEWKTEYYTTHSDGAGGHIERPAEPHQAGSLRISFLLDIFNEKSIGTGLRGIAVAAYDDNGRITTTCPLSQEGYVKRRGEITKVLNLPAHEWTSARLFGHVATPEKTSKIAASKRLAFVGYYADGGAFSYTIDPKRDSVGYAAPPDVRGEVRRSFWGRLFRPGSG